MKFFGCPGFRQFVSVFIHACVNRITDRPGLCDFLVFDWLQLTSFLMLFIFKGHDF